MHNTNKIDIKKLVTAQNALYEAQKDVVAQLLGTEDYTYRQIDNLLHQLQFDLRNYEYGRSEDLGWAWGETYEKQISRLETLIAAVTPVHEVIARACCGRFEDEDETSKAISVHMNEVDHAFWAENKGQVAKVDANCKGDCDDNDIPF